MIKTFKELVVDDKVPVFGMSEEFLPGGKEYREELGRVSFSFEREGTRAIHNDWDSENYENCNYLVLKDGEPVAVVYEYECEDMAIQKGNLFIFQGHDATGFFDVSTGEYSRNHTR